jgi:hypothetical protein
MNECLKLAGLLNEAEEKKDITVFAEKRGKGASDIAEKAEKKGGLSMLTYDHFAVKLPYYKKAADGKMNYDAAKKEYEKFCSKLHSYMLKIETMKMKDFQELVGKIEVLGELLIQQKG